MKRFSMLQIVASALLIQGFLVVSVAAQTQQSAVREAMNRMNGTWVLVKRIRPDGKEHTKPYHGVTTFNFRPSRATSSALAGATASGTFSSTESGAMDELMCDVGGAEAFALTENGRAAKTFQITANGPVEIRAMSSSDARVAAGDGVVAVTYHPLNVKGNYGVFKDGLRTPEVESVYRVAPDKSVRVRAKSGRGFVTQMQPGEMSLINEPRMAAGNNAKLTGSPEDPSHQVKSLTVNGNRMDITYGNGGRDVWMRRR
jgi:hypothetical protein